jgi:glycosyltransferase involved in cell wall biosynthesis
MKNIAILVSNPCIYDNRVIKQAESLASFGHGVTVYCLGIEGQPTEEVKNNVRYIRVVRIKSSYKIALDFIKYAIKAKSPTLAMPIKTSLAIGVISIPLILLWCLHKITKIFNDKVTFFHDIVRERTFKTFGLLVVPIMHIIVMCSFYKVLDDANYDIIHANDLDTALTGRYFAKKKNVPYVYDAHELETDRSNRRGRLIKFFIKAHERLAVKNAAAVITVSEEIAKRLQKIYKLKDRPICVLNAPWAGAEKNLDAVDVRQSIGLDEKSFLSIYVGVVNFARNLETLIEAVTHLPEHHHIAFIGPSKQDFVDYVAAETSKLDVSHRVHVMPSQEQKFLVNYIKTADLGLIILPKICDSYNFAMPNKLFEMSFAGVAILSSNLQSLREFLTRHNIGHIIEDKLNGQNIASAILLAEKDRDSVVLDEAKIAELKSSYSWEVQSDKLNVLYTKLLA